MGKIIYPNQFLKDGNQLFIGNGNTRLALTNKAGESCTNANYPKARTFAEKHGLMLAPYDTVYSAIAGMGGNSVKDLLTEFNRNGKYGIRMGSGTIIAYPEKNNVFQKGSDFKACGASIPASSIPEGAFGEWNIAIKMYPANFSIAKDGSYVFEADPKSVEIIRNFPENNQHYGIFMDNALKVKDIRINGLHPGRLDSGFDIVTFNRSDAASICQMGVHLEYYRVPEWTYHTLNVIAGKPASEPLSDAGFVEKELVPGIAMPEKRQITIVPSEALEKIAAARKTLDEIGGSISKDARQSISSLIEYLENPMKG